MKSTQAGTDGHRWALAGPWGCPGCGWSLAAGGALRTKVQGQERAWPVGEAKTAGCSWASVIPGRPGEGRGQSTQEGFLLSAKKLLEDGQGERPLGWGWRSGGTEAGKRRSRLLT